MSVEWNLESEGEEKKGSQRDGRKKCTIIMRVISVDLDAEAWSLRFNFRRKWQ